MKYFILIASLVFADPSLFAHVRNSCSENPNDSNQIVIELNGERIKISSKRMDSLAESAVDKVHSMIRDPKIGNDLKSKLDSLNIKLERVANRLVEDRRQLEKL